MLPAGAGAKGTALAPKEYHRDTRGRAQLLTVRAAQPANRAGPGLGTSPTGDNARQNSNRLPTEADTSSVRYLLATFWS
jgi:hypothetical protein